MKKLLLILLCLPIIGFGQNLYPEKIIALEFSNEREKKFNSEEAWQECNKIGSSIYKIDTLSDDYTRQLIWQLCDEMLESFWETEAMSEGWNWYTYLIESQGQITIEASSFLQSQGNNGYNPINAHDHNYQTVWIEGVNGYGIGEYLIYNFSNVSTQNTNTIGTIKIVNGYVKNRSSWQQNSRVRKLKMYINDKEFVFLNLKDTDDAQHFYIPPIEFEMTRNFSIKFEIMDVYKGTKYDDVAISEIYFDFPNSIP